MLDAQVNHGAPLFGIPWFPNMETIGQRIREMRQRRHLSQSQLGEAIGVSKAVISSWEMDRVANMRLGNLFALADALETDPRYLALGHINRLSVPVTGFPLSDTGRFRLKANKPR